jgi:hypothetical protein
MMTRTPTKLEEYLSSALAGSLVGQVARHRGTDLEDLVLGHLNGDNNQVTELANAITELGIDPDLLAAHALTAITALFMEPQNAATLRAQFTGLMWTILGNPKTGGAPPELYHKAGAALHMVLLGILDPNLIDPPAKS